MPNELMKTLTIGANTYDLPQKTSDLTNDSGFITSETDPVFTASAAHGITSIDISNWDNKAEVGSTSFTLGKASATYNNGSSSADVYAKVGASDATCTAGMVTMYGASVTGGTSTDGTFNVAGMHQFTNKNYLRLVPETATAPTGYSFQRDSTTNNATTLQTSSIKTNFSSGLQSGGVDVLTSYTETDPTVPAWAKASTKPTYTASEVGAAASNHTHSKIGYSTGSGDGYVEVSTNRATIEASTDGGGTQNILILTGTTTTIHKVVTPTADGDAANKKYVDDSITAAIGAAIGGSY